MSLSVSKYKLRHRQPVQSPLYGKPHRVLLPVGPSPLLQPLERDDIKPGFHVIVRIVRIVPVVSKKCSDDRDDHMVTLPRRSQTTRTTETTAIAWIELSSIRTIGPIV